MDNDSLSIGALAKATGASVRSLRHYDAKGLLRSRRLDNGYRVFPRGTVGQVGQIRRMLALGFSLDEIATFPHCMLEDGAEGLCPIAADAHHRRLLEVEAQIRALERQRERLVAALRDSIEAAARDELLKASTRTQP